jgi:hypothetical protein
VKHIVGFKFKPNVSDSQIQQLTDAFRQLKDKIPGIISFEHGINDSPEGLNLGFTHIYQLTFEDAKARDIYLPHPEHQKFVAEFGNEFVEDAFVVDYMPQIRE